MSINTPTHAAPGGGLVRGLQTIEAVLPWYDADGDAITNAVPKPMEGMDLILSKFRYPADDRHLDAVVRLEGDPAEAPPGRVDLSLLDQAGTVLGRESISPLPGRQMFFSVPLPDALVGAGGVLRAVWTRPGEPPSSDERRFEVAPPESVAPSGRVALTVPNDSGATARAVPFTVGVPFPRGALRSADDVRLLDEQGREVPLEARETARWSRYGSVKWILCEFAADMDGGPREFALEYGPGLRRSPAPGSLQIQERATGFPLVRAGILEARETGLYFDATGRGGFRRVLAPEALLGGYVEHEDGRVYRMSPDQPPTVEVLGEQQAVLTAEGYYVEPDSGRQFCRYKTRYFVHQGSPLLRIVHSWVFTGDSGRDRIADMGWRFPLAEGVEPEGFLRSFGGDDWVQADYMLQHDFHLYDRAAGGEVERDIEGRLPGVMAASGAGVRMTVGIRDFWQGFPSELGASGGELTFHNWPRHGRARRHWPPQPDDAIRLWFAHEGEMMDLRLPDEYAQDPLFRLTHAGFEVHWDEGQPENVNAQGIARTEEMWLLFAPADQGRGQGAKAMEGLNEEALRAVVDPAWVAASGAFHEIHHKDVENYPEEEAIFEEVALGPPRWNEHIGIYGMWLYGENLWAPYLWRQSAQLYRGLRKAHHGWPYSWVPFARSGDPRLLRAARAGTRQMYDANACHYYTEEVDSITGPAYPRRRGIWYRSAIPWAGRRRGPVSRSYQSKCEYLLHAFYLTGDRRALDMAQMLWGEEIKVEEPLPYRGRVTQPRARQTLLRGAIEMYEAAHDPWHLVFAHALAEGEMAKHTDPERNYYGHTWDAAERDFHRFTGCPEFRDKVFMNYARRMGHEDYGGWAGQSQTEVNAYAWWLTRDDYFLRRVAFEVDWKAQATYQGEPEYYRGYNVRESGWATVSLLTSWYLQHFPLALAVFEEAGEVPYPIGNRFHQAAESVEREGGQYRLRMPRVAFRKGENQPLPLDIQVSRGRGKGQGRYRVLGPDGEVALEGEWDLTGPSQNPTLPAEAPAGTYWLEVEVETDWHTTRTYRHWQGLKVPVTPAGTPEVLVPETPSLAGAVWESRYWFRVPEDAETLEAEVLVRERYRQVRRMSLWNADRERVWDANIPTYDLGRESLDLPVEVEVPEAQRGRLWRFTLPGRNSGFRVLTEIPPVFATDRDRWFLPPERP